MEKWCTTSDADVMLCFVLNLTHGIMVDLALKINYLSTHGISITIIDPMNYIIYEFESVLKE